MRFLILVTQSPDFLPRTVSIRLFQFCRVLDPDWLPISTNQRFAVVVLVVVISFLIEDGEWFKRMWHKNKANEMIILFGFCRVLDPDWLPISTNQRFAVVVLAVVSYFFY